MVGHNINIINISIEVNLNINSNIITIIDLNINNININIIMNIRALLFAVSASLSSQSFCSLCSDFHCRAFDNSYDAGIRCIRCLRASHDVGTRSGQKQEQGQQGQG